MFSEPQPPPGSRAHRYQGKVWGPGAPGSRVPALRLKYTREIPSRLVFLAGIFVFILAYMYVMHATPGRLSAHAGDTAATGTAARGSGATPPNGQGAFQGLLDGAKDGAALEVLDTTKPTDPYRTLMWNLKRYTVAEISSISVTVSAQDLLNAPAAWRGQPVRATGQLIKAPELQRLQKNEAGYEYRWRGFMVDPDDGNAIIFDVFEKPEKDFDRTDLVTVEGVFLQVVSYEARGGVKKVPFISGKSVRPFVGERRETFAASPATLLLGASLLLASIPVIGYVVSSFLSRKHEAALVDALEKARQRRVATASAKKAEASTVASATGTAAPSPAPVAPPSAPAAPPPTEATPGPAAGGAITPPSIAPDAPPPPSS